MTVTNTTFTVLKKNADQSTDIVARFFGDGPRVNAGQSSETLVTDTYGTNCFGCGLPTDLSAPRRIGARGWEKGLAVKSFFDLPGQPLLDNLRPFHAAGCATRYIYVLSWEKDGLILSASTQEGMRSSQADFYAGAEGEWCVGTATVPMGSSAREALKLLALDSTSADVMAFLGPLRGTGSSITLRHDASTHAYVHLAHYRESWKNKAVELDSAEESLVLYDLFRGFGVYEAAKLAAQEQGLSVRTVHDRIYRRDKEHHGHSGKEVHPPQE